ncbi:YqaJ viral recombinase family nuclease [Marinobacterium lutimaris]|uniref:Putative phage-type endonuclease n=1 Tax=Marinobacterium lutimaris TaxID=568106 RepID=A0A1H6DSM7_9GAMM|nr:YqaJ viral recombinase family protein [Marinobacterium lutimaris]SEG88392.1 putative phage-type endonuclease [Marinobacterium lutimaris]
MKIVNLTQGTQAWLDWRAQGVSASDMPTIMGKNPYKTAYQLWLEKTGRANPPDLSNNPNVQRGNRLEPLAREFCEDRDNEILLPVCAEDDELPILRASFDGLSSGGIPYEFKAPTENRFAELQDVGTESATYEMYAWQVKTQSFVAQSKKGLLFFYMEDERHLEFTIELTAEDMEAIDMAARQFWDCIQNDTPPPLDPERDVYIPKSGEDQFRWETFAEQWRENQEQFKALEEQMAPLKKSQDELKKAMCDMMGDFQSTDYAGVKVTRFTRQGSIDYAKYCKELGIGTDVLEPYRKKPTWQSRVTLSADELLNAEAIGNQSMPADQGGKYF